MWFNPHLNSLEWLYALPAGVTDTGGYEVFDFPGGMYAVAVCRDEGAEIEKTNQLIHEWIGQSDVFCEPAAGEDAPARYDMGHVINPHNAKDMMGYYQMDLFVPVSYRQRSK